MEAKIKAVFESCDAADLAVWNIRREDIPILARDTYRVDEPERGRDIFHLAPVYSAAGRSDYGSQPYAPLPVITDVPNAEDEKTVYDTVSDDVILELSVPKESKDAVIQKLRSMHGRSIIVQ